MDKQEAAKLKIIIDSMIELEKKISVFYKLCHKKLPDSKIWEKVSQDEEKHADNLSIIANMLINDPSNFDVGKIYSPAAIFTIISGVEDNIKRLEAGKLTYNNTLFISRDYENSIIEKKYSEIVVSKKVEYVDLINSIVLDTFKHRQIFDDEIARIKNGK